MLRFLNYSNCFVVFFLQKKGPKKFILLHVARPTVIMFNMNIFLKQFVGFSKVIILNIYEQLFFTTTGPSFNGFTSLSNILLQHMDQILVVTCISNICFKHSGQLSIVTW